MFRQYRIKIKGHLAASSITTARPDSTRGHRITARKPYSSRKRAATEPNQTTYESGNYDCKICLYFSADGKPTLPEAVRSPILHRNRSHEILKQGPQVREGLVWFSR